MKTLLKQEDTKFIKCSPSSLRKALEHYLKMQTVIFCDKIKKTMFNERLFLYLSVSYSRKVLLHIHII